MAFHIDTYDIPPLRCYHDALCYWDRIKPWRGDGDKNTRPLASRSKRHMTIRKLNDESIAMSLYGTDVVVYHKDNTITLERYSSASTDRFASALTPGGIQTSFNNGAGYLIHLSQDGHTFTFNIAHRKVTLKQTDRGWFPVDANAFTPFKKYVVNIKKANAALKECRFNDFVAWLKALRAMGQTFAEDPWKRPSLTPGMVASLLKEGGEGWMQVAAASSGDPELVRQALYIHFECIDVIEVPAVAGYDVSCIRASHNRWGRLVSRY